MKSLVFDWLSGTDAKIAKKFQKEVGATALTPDSPKLKDIVAQFSNSPAGKRKAEPVTNGSSSKKAKKVSRLSLTGAGWRGLKLRDPGETWLACLKCRVPAPSRGYVAYKLALRPSTWP